MAELAAWLFTAEGITATAAATSATAAVVSASQAGKGGTKGLGLQQPTAKATEAQLAAYKQQQRDLLRKRRASLATSMKLEEPILGKQSLLGA